jgi:hypothetical protein
VKPLPFVNIYEQLLYSTVRYQLLLNLSLWLTAATESTRDGYQELLSIGGELGSP